MKFFSSFFGRASAPKPSSPPASIVPAKSPRATYDAVRGIGSGTRKRVAIETTGNEDSVLTHAVRTRLVAMQRDANRNDPNTLAISQQRKVNIVGNIGGKLTLTTADDAFNVAAANWFNGIWAKEAEFTQGLHFNDLLKLCVTAKDCSGDFVLVFDDGVLGGTGRIKMFEADEIADPDSATVAKLKAEGKTVSQGLVYDSKGRTVGVCCSTSERGRPSFSSGKFILFNRTPNQRQNRDFWVYVSRNYRANQGRGVPLFAATASTLADIYELVQTELQAAKLNAKLVMQLVDTSAPDQRPQGLEAFEPAEGEAAEVVPQAPIALDLDPLKQLDVAIANMPAQTKLEIFATNRPNEKLIEFSKNMQGLVSAVYGMGRTYVTLDPESSYTAFRGASVMAWVTFEEEQKFFERYVLDWAAYKAISFALDNGELPGAPAGWENNLEWRWPTLREVDELNAVNAATGRLRIGFGSYRDRFGSEWESRLEQIAEEMNACKRLGLTHPMQVTVAGAQVQQPQEGNQK